jgi:hypothetical protein
MKETEEMQKVREGTKVHGDGGFSLDNENSIEHYRVMVAISELAFRINTGAKMTRVSIIQFCRDTYGTKGKNNKTVLAEMMRHYEDTYGRELEYPPAYRALGIDKEA